MIKNDYIILVSILLIALFFRLFQITTNPETYISIQRTYDLPLADLHSWRQVDTAAVARNFARDGIDFLHPRYDDLSSTQSGLENPKGYRFVEFPLYNAIVSILYNTLGGMPVEAWGRIVSALFSLVIIGCLYYLVLHEHSRIAAAVAALVYAVFPFFVFVSRMVLPETTALSFSILSIFLLYRYAQKKTPTKQYIFLLASAASFACGLLAKPTVIFYAIPLGLIFIRTHKFSVFKNPSAYLYFILAFIPLLWWRIYIQAFPEGIPASAWLIRYVNTFEGPKNIFFKPAFIRWIFYERISNIIFGGYLSFLFLLGLVSKSKSLVLLGIFLAGFVYLFTFQGGNLQHEYYQTLLLPALAIYVGIGTSFLYSHKQLFVNQALMTVMLVGIFALSFAFSHYRVQEFYRIPNDLVQMGSLIKTFTKPGDKIVTDRLGDTTLLYLADRKGAAALYKEPFEFKAMGYKYLVTQNPENIKKFKEQYKLPVAYELNENKFAIFKL